MADIADDAQDLIELTVAAAVSRTKSKKFNKQPKGVCYFCLYPVETHQLFCDKDCEHDHTRDQINKRV